LMYKYHLPLDMVELVSVVRRNKRTTHVISTVEDPIVADKRLTSE
jgi:hypothetical protein